MSKNKVVVKSMNILQLFEESEALSINEMVEISKLPKTSVVRMVNSLSDMGFLSKKSGKKYVLGLQLLRYGQLVSERLDLRKIALPFMQQLRDETNESVNLALPEESGIIYVEKVDAKANQTVRVYTSIGRQAPYYAGAAPRILLAFMNEDRLTSYLESVELTQFASETITNKTELKKVLAKTRMDGYTVSFSELTDGAASIAAPLRSHTGEVVAAISITGPDYRFKEYKTNVIQKVIGTANEISKQMGLVLKSF